MNRPKTADASECTQCGACRRVCPMLNKHNVDIGDAQAINLAYNCFLCGKCTEVCPQGIDGRQLMLNERRRRVREAGGKPAERGYGLLLAEKSPYRFTNYRHARPGSVLFPGCSLISLYPRTTRRLETLLRDVANMGVVYDCCGKPVDELGLEARAARDMERLERRLRDVGATEVVAACPTCYSYLHRHLSLPVVDVFSKLAEGGLGHKITADAPLFVPCPDRASHNWLHSLEQFLEDPPHLVDNVACCGLGGCGFVKEPKLSRRLARNIGERTGGHVFTYCASCAGNLQRAGVDAQSVLPAIVGVDEQPDTKHSLLNRVKASFV